MRKKRIEQGRKRISMWALEVLGTLRKSHSIDDVLEILDDACPIAEGERTQHNMSDYDRMCQLVWSSWNKIVDNQLKK